MKIPRFAIFLAGALCILSTVFLLGRTEQRTWPSIDNSLGSGLGALAELVRADGYQVVRDRANRPRPKPGQLIIAALVGDGEQTPAKVLATQGATGANAFESRLVALIKGGQKALIIRVPSELPYRSDSQASPTPYAITSQGEQRTATYNPLAVYVATGPTFKTNAQDLGVKSGADLWSGQHGSLSSIFTVGKGYAFILDGGMIATNRFLAQANNAELVLDHIHRLAPPGSTIVFAEAGFGNAGEESIVTTLGNWAVAARLQTVLLLLIIAFTVSRRFGAQYVEKPQIRGARDMVDALAELYRRGSHTQPALKQLCEEVELTARRKLKVARELPREDFLKKAGPKFINAWTNAWALATSPHRLSGRDASEAARELETQLKGLDSTLR